MSPSFPRAPMHPPHGPPQPIPSGPIARAPCRQAAGLSIPAGSPATGDGRPAKAPRGICVAASSGLVESAPERIPHPTQAIPAKHLRVKSMCRRPRQIGLLHLRGLNRTSLVPGGRSVCRSSLVGPFLVGLRPYPFHPLLSQSVRRSSDSGSGAFGNVRKEEVNRDCGGC